MALVIVQTTDGKRELLHEEVHVCHLNDTHSFQQIAERLLWAIEDAEDGRLRQRDVPNVTAVAPYGMVPQG